LFNPDEPQGIQGATNFSAQSSPINNPIIIRIGMGLVVGGCRLILRYAKDWYPKHKSGYSEPQQLLIENLFGGAETISVMLRKIGI
jgi:hypothetical protein